MRFRRLSELLMYYYDSTEAYLRTVTRILAFLALAVLFLFASLPTAFAEPETPHNPISTAYEPETSSGKTCTLTKILVVGPEILLEGEDALRALFEPTLYYEDEEYRGELEMSSVEYEIKYRSKEHQIERIETFPELPAKDLIYIPTSLEFEISSDEYMGARTTAPLELMAVSWTQDGYDAEGRPVGFTATVTYRGIENELVYDYVVVTATYSGETSLIEPVLPVDVPTIPVRSELPFAAFSDVSASDNLLAAIIAGITAILLGVLALVLLMRYWNVRLVAVLPDGRTRTHVRKHVRLVNGVAELVIPERCVLTSAAVTHLIRVKQALVRKGGTLRVVWRGCLLFQLPIQAEIDLQKQLIELVSTGLLLEDIEKKAQVYDAA